MKIFLFVDNASSAIQTHVACKLDKEVFFMVDSVHVGDMNWLRRNFSDIPHRMYTYLGESTTLEQPQHWNLWNISNLKDEFLFFPTFVVCFDCDQEVTLEQWKAMDYYFLKKLGIVEKGGEEMDCEGVVSLIDQCSKKLLRSADLSSYDPAFMDSVQQAMATCYEFDYEINTAWDVCLAQITKPNVDRPYTVVLRNFIENGFARLFTSLYICTSWGVCRADRDFLEKLWERLEMEGEFDLDKMLKEHTDLCHPGIKNVPEIEPEVYRLNIKDTIEQLKKKRQKMFMDVDCIMEE